MSSLIKVGVVVPSNRPEMKEKWLSEWQNELWGEDNGFESSLYWISDDEETWEDIKRDLGKMAWIIPVRSDCIRSYGFLQAYRDGCQVTITLDDDVFPGVSVIKTHVDWVNRPLYALGWQPTLRGRNCPPTRGLPLWRTVGINHGLWTGIPDVSAETQLKGYRNDYEQADRDNDFIVPYGHYYPMSGMNVAFDTRLTSWMYFTLQGWDIREPYESRWGMDRAGDIIAGVISKTLIDASTRFGVHSGEPYVHHIRASDPVKNHVLESFGSDYPGLLSHVIRGSTTLGEISNRLFNWDNKKFKKYNRNLSEALRIWHDLTRPSNFASSRSVPEPKNETASHKRLAKSEIVP